MKYHQLSAHDFMQMLAGSTAKEACILIKYGNDEELLAFRDIAMDLLSGTEPLPEILISFDDNIRALAAAQTSTDVRRIFLGNDATRQAPTTHDFFTDLADANEREGDILMRCASDKHLCALRDTAMQLLVGAIPLTENQEYALEPFWAEIRELALSKTAKEISKTLFQHFGGRLLLLQGMVIPSLAEIESNAHA